MTNHTPETALLRTAIEQEVFIRSSEQRIYPPSSWIFDFRKVLLRGDILDAFAEIFYARFQHLDRLQVGGMESAAIPLVTAVVNKFFREGKNINGFYIRKSRKKKGLLNVIEGSLRPDDPIILLDDLLNRGTSFQKEIKILEESGFAVRSVFVVLRFRELPYYTYFHNKGIPIESIFTLRDFRESLGTDFLAEPESKPVSDNWQIVWRFAAPNPKLHKVTPKSGVITGKDTLYFGSDDGRVWCLDRLTGKARWSYQVRGFRKPAVYATPLGWGDRLYVGASNGALYALDARTGERQFVVTVGNVIEGALGVAKDRGLILVPTIFGLVRKRGGVAALHHLSGKTIWEARVNGEVVGSPAYSKRWGLVYFGDDLSTVHAVRVDAGETAWTKGLSGEVRGRVALDDKESVAVVQTMAGEITALHPKTGNIMWQRNFEEAGFASDPVIAQGRVYSACLDKFLYCLDLATGKELWKFETRGRVFASPLIVEDCLYIGSNDGILYELDAATGQEKSAHQFSERITHQVASSSGGQTFFVPTQANEVYCLKYVPESDRDGGKQ